MGFCTARNLSYISASLQLVCCIIGLVLVILSVEIADSNGFRDFGLSAEDATMVVLICGVVCLTRIVLLLTLIVGIQQERRILLSIYVYAHYVFLLLCVIMVVAGVVMEILSEWPLYAILIFLLICSFFFGPDILCFAPIVTLHRRMRTPPFHPMTDLQFKSY